MRASPTSRPRSRSSTPRSPRAREPRFHHYSPTPGLPELRAAIAHKTKRDSGVDCAAEQVLVTNGGKHAVYNTFQVLCDPGDEVLVPAPYWTSYPECIALGGGVPVVLPTTEASGFRVSIEQLEAAVTPRTKALLFVSPSNPTGAVYPPDEVEAIGRWALERGIWVVTDEIYEHLTYDGHVFSSMPGPRSRARRQCVILNGVAKTYAMTGWRVGWMIGPRDVIAAATNLQSHSTSNVSNVAQAAALAAVAGDLYAVAEMRDAFARRGQDDVRAALGDRRRHAASSRRARSTASRRSRACSGARSPAAARRRRSSCASCCSTWRRSRSFPARRSARPATPGCGSRSATTTSARACAASPTCSLADTGTPSGDTVRPMTNKRAIITGCSTGIGRATAIELSARGYDVVATARRRETLDDLKVAETSQLDVDDDASVAAALAAVGPVDVLVNNAGFGVEGAVETVPLGEVRRMFETNFFGAARMIQAFVPGMRERGSGAVVNVSSVAGIAARPARRLLLGVEVRARGALGVVAPRGRAISGSASS